MFLTTAVLGVCTIEETVVTGAEDTDVVVGHFIRPGRLQFKTIVKVMVCSFLQ